MSRLTRKSNREYYETHIRSVGENYTYEQFLKDRPYTLYHIPSVEYETKLGKLEDLEEELGCPLEVVFKALTKGIEYEIEITTYYAVGDTIPIKRLEKRKNIREIKLKKYIDKFAFLVPYDYSRDGILQNDIIYLKDYKKTWWLKGEKENE